MDVVTLGAARAEAAKRVRIGNPANTVVLFGDSITANCAYAEPGTATPTSGSYIRNWSSRSWWHVANRALGQRFTLLNNAGISGNTTAQMLARIQTDVIAYAPGWAVVMAGINDVQTDVPIATTQANLTAICSRLIAAGIRVVLCTPLTSGGSVSQLGQTNWATGTAYSAGNAVLQSGTQYAAVTSHTSGTFATDLAAGKWVAVPNRLHNIIRLQRWVANYARTTPGVTLVEWHKVMQDPASGTNLTAPASTSDGTHPNGTGADRMGAQLATVLSGRAPAVDHLPVTNADPDSLITNPMQTGTSGSHAASGGSGSLATGIVASWNGTAGVYVASKVARTDGVGGTAGEWQQVQMTTAGWLILRYLDATTASLGLNVGDTVQAAVEFETSNDWTNVIALWANLMPVTTGFSPLGNWRSVDMDSPLAAGQSLTRPTSGVLLTTPCTLPANTGRLQLAVHIYGTANASLPATGTVRIGRVSLLKPGSL